MQFLQADKLFDGHSFLPDKTVLVLNDRKEVVELIDSGVVDQGKVQQLNGMLIPGFVNAHCHTELSHLKNKIPMHTGLPAFGKQVMILRNSVSKDELKEHIKEADKEMLQNGIVAVGDICNTDDSFRMKEESQIFYHSFIELLGLNPARVSDSFNAGTDLFYRLKSLGLPGSLAPHAPYSTSKELIEKISNFNSEKKLPGSIHNQESLEEAKFFNGEKSGFNGLYDFLGLDISWFKAPKMSSLNYYASALKNQQTILVHNTFTSQKDIDLLNSQNIYWCFCPNANMYIENVLPDLSLFGHMKNNICLGTDSLASNTQLSLLSEASLLIERGKFELQDVLQSMTFVAAKALNIENQFGSFIPGKNTGLNLLEYKNKQLRLTKKIS